MGTMIMKRKMKQLKITMNGKRMKGVLLLEVVLAIAVFAFGMLALMQLQGNLARSSADANTRTVATNIAEELIETIRGYQEVTADPGNGLVDYLELVGAALDTTVNRGGLDYEVRVEIRDFWYNAATDSFISTVSDPFTPQFGLAFADFKQLAVTVVWSTDPDRDFYVDDASPGADLGRSSDGHDPWVYDITVYEVIPSSPPILGAKIAADINAPAGGPAVDYTPGFNPDTVALDLDGEKFKESSTPIPDVIRSGELTETYFEVVSYNSNNIFLRREEFITVGCECTLHTSADADGTGGFRATVWNGIEFTEGEFVTKSFGTSANNQQSVFCDVCCRDHHDGGGATTGTDADGIAFEDRRLVYNAWATSINATQDHPHYKRSDQGVLSDEAVDGEDYVEACRLIRKDGFFRAAQDFNQEGFFGFAEDYLDNVVEVAEYSSYVTETIADFYGSPNNQSELKQPGPPLQAEFTDPVSGVRGPFIPASDPSGTATNLPTPLNSDQQQLRSRGVYVDYMTVELSNRIDACADPDASACVLPDFTTALEVFPFFDVQLTKLSNWDDEPLNSPVDVTNEAITSNNAHSRGRAELKGVGPSSKADHAIHKGNVGIAATDPIIPNPDPQAPTSTFLNIDTGDGASEDVAGFIISGDILSGVGGVRAIDVEITFNEAQCGKTPTGYRCIVPGLAVDPSLTVSNYFKNNRTLLGCSDPPPGGLGTGSESGTGRSHTTTFALPKRNLSGADIRIETSPCG